MKRERADALLLLVLGLLLFGWLAPRAGLHLDDYGFWADFEGSGPAKLWRIFIEYVPGRNLYIPLYYGLHRLCGGSPAAMHGVGLLLDVINPLLLYVLARRLGAASGVALAAAGLFLAWPNHGETHWWTSSIMMNLFSTSAALGAVLLAGETRLPRATRLGLAAALFALALFDYDQVYLLWIPLLAFARLRDPQLKPRLLLSWAGLFVFLNALHLAARLFSPWAGGGRPMPQAGLLLRSAAKAVLVTVTPLRRNPVLDDFPGGLLVAVLLAAGLGALGVWRCSRGWEKRREAVLPLAAFGAAWWLLAYAPNFLWYISPRHNYLPSAGVALAAAALASRLSASASMRRALTIIGAGLFALFATSAWSDGLAWAASTTLHARFGAAAKAAVAPATPVVLLVGAPRDVRSAPGFSQPADALGALRRAGLSPSYADLSAAPNRLGVFYGGQRELFGEDARPSYTSFGDTAFFTTQGGGFACAKAVRVLVPGLAPRVLTPAMGDCEATVDFDAPAALIGSRSLGRGAPAPEGPALESASLTKGPDGSWDLTMVWRAAVVPADFASHLRLLDASGRLLWLSTTRPSPAEHEAFWPLYDDARPASAWKPGERVAQTYRLRAPAGLAGVASARLTLFSPGGSAAWAFAGRREAHVEVR